MLIALAVLAMQALSGLLAASTLRLRGILPTLLTAYVVAVAEAAGLVLLLSPFHAVTRTWLATGEEIVLAVTAAAWWLYGRPLPATGRVGATTRTILADPAIAVLAAVVAAAVVYEVVLAATTPANNWDSLTYHLPRVAAWLQHHGVFWVPDAPTDRINEFQPLAEQLVLFVFAGSGDGSLFALPQLVAEVAIVAAVFATAREIGFGPRAAAGAALLVPSLTLVALEATTAQNDLVAASFPAVAAALLLQPGRRTAAVAGLAVALGLGTKLTTALVLPVLVWLAVRAGRTRLAAAVGGGIAGLALVGMWGYVLNLVHTGHLLGQGQSRDEYAAPLSLTGPPATLGRSLYRLLDLSGLSNGTVVWSTCTALATGLVLLEVERRRLGVRPAAAAAALPLLVALSPALVLASAAIVRAAADAAAPDALAAANRRVNEDYSAFGPLGAIAVAVAVAAPVVAALRGRRHAPRLALAAVTPLFLVLVALTVKDNPWLSRFLLVPLALTAPLFAVLFARRAVAVPAALLATVVLGLSVDHNELKPWSSRFGHPWSLSAADAAALTWQPAIGAMQQDLDVSLPPRACVGAALGSDDPTYLLFAPGGLDRRVAYLPADDAVGTATRTGLRYVVVAAGARTAADFASAGWTVRSLAPGDRPLWALAQRDVPEPSDCGAASQAAAR